MVNNSNQPEVSVIIPMLNEADNVDELFQRLFSVFFAKHLRVEIVIADGGSIDGTKDKVQAWAEKSPVKFIAANSGHGLSGDVRIAAEHAAAPVCVVMDADLSHSPETAPDLAIPVCRGADIIVVGSRYVQGGRTPNWPWTRKIISRIAALFAMPFVEVRDSTSGFFALKKERLTALGPEVNGFKILLEVLLSSPDKPQTKELPISFNDRTKGQSKMSLKQVMFYLHRLMILTGGAVSPGNALRFALVGIAGLIVDLSVFHILFNNGQSLGFAHIASFSVATIVNYILNSRWAFSATAGSSLGWKRYLRFLAVCLMALFLRGGVLAIFIQHGISAQVSLVFAIISAAIINYFGNAFFVFPRSGIRSEIKWAVAAIGLTVYSVLLRLIYLGLPNLLPEEAYYWNYAQHPAWGYLDHPPMVAWLISLGTSLFGHNEFGVRIGAMLCWFIATAFTCAFARNILGRKSAIQSLLLMSILPVFFIYGFFEMPDAPLIACWAGTIFFMHKALISGHKISWWGVGLFLGLGMLSKYSIALLGLAMFVFALSDRSARKWFKSFEPYAAIVFALLLFMPVIYWNANNQWASFAFQTAGRLSRDSHFSLHLLLLSVIFLLTPVGFIKVYKIFFSKKNNYSEPFPNPEKLTARNQLFVKIFTLVPLSVFIFFSLSHHTKLSWTGPLWIAIIPVLALEISKKQGRYSGVTVTAVMAMLFYGAVFHYATIGLPGVPYLQDFSMPIAWQEAGDRIEKIEDGIEVKTGQEPIIVGMDKYFIASELSFYRHNLQNNDIEALKGTSSRNLFNDNGLMFDWWTNKSNHIGKTLILVSKQFSDLDDNKIGKFFNTLDTVQQLQLSKNNKKAGILYYRIAYGYNGV
ncbi:MAG: glycosyltransferase family 39 protein [Candidatus Omnitrophica bacterium]|nr:glycosyltransferase family 39 protein [Candidatus Omnitrophota bacterium]